jgi:hypothetical protein
MKRLVQVSMLWLCSFLIAVAPALGQQFCPWSTPEPVPCANPLAGCPNLSTTDFFPTISKDGLSLYFTSQRPGGVGTFDIWVSQRANINLPWGPPAHVGTNINTIYGEYGPSISPDGHTMYFASGVPGGFGPPSPPFTNDIYFSRRHNKRDDFGWQTPVNLGNGVNTEYNEANPEIFEDDDSGVITLYFDSNRPSGPGPGPEDNDVVHNGNDIYTSILQPAGTFGPATLVAELSTTSRDRTVSIRRDGSEIFFASDRPVGYGGFDLWTSTRASTSDDWSEPINLGPTVNSNSVDAGPSLSFDGTTLYFSSNRAGSLGFLDLYISRRQKMHGPGSCQ